MTVEQGCSIVRVAIWQSWSSGRVALGQGCNSDSVAVKGRVAAVEGWQ